MQTAIVIAILVATALLAVRWLVRTLRGKGGCHCGCQGCPHSGGQQCHCHDGNLHLPDIRL